MRRTEIDRVLLRGALLDVCHGEALEHGYGAGRVQAEEGVGGIVSVKLLQNLLTWTERMVCVCGGGG